MGKRRSDASSRRFFDEFEGVKAGRFRAMGVIDPAKSLALIPFPNGRTKLIATRHTWFAKGGGWSFFTCPKCARRAAKLYLVDDAPLCVKCCEAINIRHATRYGFGRAARREAKDRYLDQLIAKLETGERLKLKPTPASWHGKAKLVYNSRKLSDRMRRSMVSLRLSQLASQQTKDSGSLSLTRAYKPRTDAIAAIPELAQVWKARTYERLQQALDIAHNAVIKALKSNDPKIRLIAARIFLRTKQARDRGIAPV